MMASCFPLVFKLSVVSDDRAPVEAHPGKELSTLLSHVSVVGRKIEPPECGPDFESDNAGHVPRLLTLNPPRGDYKVELLCIIDSYNKGMLIGRTEKRIFILPQMPPLHWLERYFEWMYLRKYR